MIFARLRIFVIACIALLQCFVPLIHAHAYEHGAPAPQRMHIHVLDLDAFHAFTHHTSSTESDSSESEIKASVSVSPIVGVSNQFKRDLSLLPVIGALVAAFLAAVFVIRRIAFPHARHPAVRPLFHNRPPATAPPGLAV